MCAQVGRLPLHIAAMQQGNEAEKVVKLLTTYPEGAKEKDDVCARTPVPTINHRANSLLYPTQPHTHCFRSHIMSTPHSRPRRVYIGWEIAAAHRCDAARQNGGGGGDGAAENASRGGQGKGQSARPHTPDFSHPRFAPLPHPQCTTHLVRDTSLCMTSRVATGRESAV